MILKPWQVKQLAQGLPATPCNRSSSNSSSTAATTENVDRRVVNDRGLSTSGDGNYVNASMSTTTVTNMLDGGAIGAAFDFAKAGTQNAYKSTADALGFAGDAFRDVTDSHRRDLDFVTDAFGQVSDAQREGLRLNLEQSRVNADGLLDGFGKLLDFARDTSATAKAVNENATANVAAAYQGVQEISTGQRFLVAGAIAIAGVVAVSKLKG